MFGIIDVVRSLVYFLDLNIHLYILEEDLFEKEDSKILRVFPPVPKKIS
jgi:hypothetical protein